MIKIDFASYKNGCTIEDDDFGVFYILYYEDKSISFKKFLKRVKGVYTFEYKCLEEPYFKYLWFYLFVEIDKYFCNVKMEEKCSLIQWSLM
jgi:hypothetical protein